MINTRVYSTDPSFRSASSQSGGNKAVFFQPKLTINNPNDEYEREADAVADKVMRMENPGIQLKPLPVTSIQRKCAYCEEEEKKLQRKPINQTESATDSSYQNYIGGLSSSGQSLPQELRSYYEPRFGYDFSKVKLHTDAMAAKSAQSVNALAYTTGTNIVFNNGEYSPGTKTGQHLLAHELTHVVQQSGTSTPAVQRQVFENNFPGGGQVDTPMTGEHRLWNFDIGQSTLKPGHLDKIPEIASEIKNSLDSANPEEQVDIEGQASFTGTAGRNEELATSRALAVKEALVAQGIAENQIRITVVGESKSEAGASQESFARSRAVRVIMVPRVKMTPPPTPPAQTGCRPGLPNGGDLKLDIQGEKVTFGPERQFVVLRAGTATTPGMQVIASPFVTPPKCGVLSFIQNVMTFRQIIYKDGSRNTMQTQGFVLDGGDPYHCAMLNLFFVADDGPGMGVSQKQEPHINTIEVREEFRTFLMFQPNNGARRTHQVAEWRWVGQVVNNDTTPGQGTLQLDNISRITPQAGSGFFTAQSPVLSPNIADIPFVTDASAGPAQDSLASKLIDGLNKARPKVKNGNVCSFGKPPSPGPKGSEKLADKPETEKV